MHERGHSIHQYYPSNFVNGRAVRTHVHHYGASHVHHGGTPIHAAIPLKGRKRPGGTPAAKASCANTEPRTLKTGHLGRTYLADMREYIRCIVELLAAVFGARR